MADDASGERVLQPTSEARESLSQFVAKVLDQLALSAWLPSAALVIGLSFIFHIGEVLEAGGQSGNPLQTVPAALVRLSDVGLGEALMLVVLVIVLTMVTQAFSYGTIRVLEGYWGSGERLQKIADRRCDDFRERRTTLETRKATMIDEIWNRVRRWLELREDEAVAAGKPAPLSPDQIRFLRQRITGVRTTYSLTPEEKEAVRQLAWQSEVDPNLLRRLRSLELALADYPAPHEMMPTLVGNILRRHELLAVGRTPVPSFVQERFHRLPQQIQEEHDEQRTRLDLYSTMLGVVGAVSVAGMVRLMLHPYYVVGIAVLGALAAVAVHRATVATARAYGNLLLVIARQPDKRAPARLSWVGVRGVGGAHVARP
jgi:hypothetical protein